MASYASIIVILCVSSSALATPPSQQDYGLCSQVFLMHQYCTSQRSPTSTEVSPRPTVQPRIGKAGPRGLRGPPGIVNYTAIEEKIDAKFSDVDFENWNWKRTVNDKLEEKDREIQELQEQLDQKSEAIVDIEKKLALITTTDCGSVDQENAKVWRTTGGIFDIFLNGRIREVYCDLTTDGGDWTIFQKRFDGSVDFYRTWDQYAEGFGSASGEFWLGLEKIYQLTRDGAYELRVDLTDWDGRTAYAKYGTFSIAGKSDNYRLAVGQYTGDAGDSLARNSGRQFSARNRDLDVWSSNCAETRGGAWWFYNCGLSHLNGRYNETSQGQSGVFWNRMRSKFYYSLKKSEMKFRRKN